MRAVQRADAQFSAMGTTVRVIVTVSGRMSADAAGLADRASQQIRQLEARWSRFSPTSEISELNANHGSAVRVSAETLLLVRLATEGWQITCGRFDPTMLDSLRSLGYSKTFEEVRSEPQGCAGPPLPGHGCGAIEVTDERSMVRLPAGVGFDPGGIGKGLAADLVVQGLLSSGAAGACVELGGDVRVGGEGPEGAGWVICIDDPRPGKQAIGDVWLAEGAVASSSSVQRQWTAGGRSYHHLLDPSSGLPTDTSIAGASVVAESCWLAEVLATAACVDGEGSAIEANGACGVVVPLEGSPARIGDFDRYAK